MNNIEAKIILKVSERWLSLEDLFKEFNGRYTMQWIYQSCRNLRALDMVSIALVDRKRKYRVKEDQKNSLVELANKTLAEGANKK